MPNKELITLQQKVADELLLKIRRVDPTAIIAGGCCRDWFANKPAKDIDLFYYDGMRSGMENIKMLEGLLGPLVFTQLGKDYQGPLNSNISSVLETYIEGVEINLIAWNRKTYNVTKTFPAYNSRMHYLPGYGNDKGKYLEDIYSLSYLYCKEIYVKEDINQKYWKKLRDKFPDCKIMAIPLSAPVSQRDISLKYVADWGAPTEEELSLVKMLHPEMRLEDPWLVGCTDLTNQPPEDKPQIQGEECFY